MPFEMRRVFLAAPIEWEDERQVFYNAVGDANETEGLGRGVLLVPVSLPPNLTDKRAYQSAIEDNIRSAQFFVQLLQDSWGPPERHFERDYDLAAGCTDRAVFFKSSVDKVPDAGVAELKAQNPAAEFQNLDELKSKLKAKLSEWLAA